MKLHDILLKRGQRNPNNLNLPQLAMNFIWNFLRPKLVNFKTSILGIGMILMGINSGWQELVALVNGGTPDMDILNMAGANVLGGYGLLVARDADKTTLASVGRETMQKQGAIVLPYNTERKENGR